MGKLISAGVIPARRTPEGWKLLILRAYRTWDFPKGRVDPGEAPLAAAKREAVEEAALADLAFPFGEIYCDTEPYAGGKIAPLLPRRDAAGRHHPPSFARARTA